LFDAAQNDLGLVPEAVGGLAQSIVEMGDALAAQVLQFHPFQVVPDPLGGVQPGRRCAPCQAAGREQTGPQRLPSALLRPPFFDLGPTLLLPAPDGFLVPLGSPMYRLLAAPTTGFQDAAHLEGSYETPQPVSNQGRHSRLGPDIPRKPKDSAPRANSSSSWPRCSEDSRGAAPGGGRWRKPATPPSLPRFTHWLTAPWVRPRLGRSPAASNLSGAVPRPVSGGLPVHRAKSTKSQKPRH